MADSAATKNKTPLELQFKDVQVTREGTQIIIPPGMAYWEAREWLTRKEEAENKVVEVNHRIDCFPLDGILAVKQAMEEKYGFTNLRGLDGFWGEELPMMIQVVDADGKYHSAPVGKLQPPTWEGGYITISLGPVPQLVIGGQMRVRHEPAVQEIFKRTKELLRTKSIYKGQAMRIDLSWMSDGRNFHPINDAPQFMDVKDITEADLILPASTEFELRTNVWMLLEKTEACQRYNIPLKQGVLLYGPYGTGKTLTARVTAEKATRNKWTFFYLKNVKHVAAALKLAEHYAPCVIFAEDVDTVTGNRDEDMNQILNTLDGVDTKGKAIITILTTNNADAIDPSFLRAGRIDTLIHMGAPDAKAAERFVKLYAKDDDARTLLAEGLDLTPVGKSLEGYVPAFIAEAVQKAKRHAIAREGEDIVGKVNEHDLLLASEALKLHAQMANPKKEKSIGEKVIDAINVVESVKEKEVECPECNHLFET